MGRFLRRIAVIWASIAITNRNAAVPPADFGPRQILVDEAMRGYASALPPKSARADRVCSSIRPSRSARLSMNIRDGDGNEHDFECAKSGARHVSTFRPWPVVGDANTLLDGLYNLAH